MKNLGVTLILLIVILMSCKKKDNDSENNITPCNTIYYHYTENAITFDTIATIQSGSIYSIDSLVAKFKINLHIKGTLDSGCVATLTNLSLGNGIMENKWDFGDGSTSTEVSPVHNFIVDGLHTIKLIVTNFQWKTDTAKFSFTYTLSPRLFLPNVFTPNNDGINDLLIPFYTGIDTSSNNYTLSVKDINDNLLFETHDIHESFGYSNINFNTYHDGDTFYVNFSAKTINDVNINGCTPLLMKLTDFSCNDTNLVFPDQIDNRYGKIFPTSESLCH